MALGRRSSSAGSARHVGRDRREGGRRPRSSVNSAGVASTFRLGSTARTSRVCAPGSEAAELGQVLGRRGARAELGHGDRVERALERHAGLVAGEGEQRRQVGADLGRRAPTRSSCRARSRRRPSTPRRAGRDSTSRCGFSAMTSKVCGPDGVPVADAPGRPRCRSAATRTSRARRRRASTAGCASGSSTLKVNVASCSSVADGRAGVDRHDRRGHVAARPAPDGRLEVDGAQRALRADLELVLAVRDVGQDERVGAGLEQRQVERALEGGAGGRVGGEGERRLGARRSPAPAR